MQPLHKKRASLDRDRDEAYRIGHLQKTFSYFGGQFFTVVTVIALAA
jgi:hypothetical protein